MTRRALLAIALAACGRASATPDRDPVEAGTVLAARTETGELQQFRIDWVTEDPKDRDDDVRLYGVSIREPDARTWRPYCSPDFEGHSAAIPVEGSWNARGDLVPATDALTFACTSGAIAKCIRFGYKPWLVRDGISLAPYHAACMRMVRADYCGDGRPHTVEGTVIDIWDRLGIQARDERDGHPEVFEAAWGPQGAVYLNVPRWSDDVADVVEDCPDHFAGHTSRDRAIAPTELEGALMFDARYIRSADRRIAL